jgi:hypothetical protein
MTLRDELKSAVLQLDQNPLNFERLAIEIFQFQAQYNQTYNSYINHLGINVNKVTHLEKIPFLPIEFFKAHKVSSGALNHQMIFESSGTTGSENSKHYVEDLPFYEMLSFKIFQKYYGPLNEYTVLGLLPSYLERNNSSLVYMVQAFIYKTLSKYSGFYLNNTSDLLKAIKKAFLEYDKNHKVLLIGVTFALLDLAESEEDLTFLEEYKSRIVIMETGGMKGRRKELLRDEVHGILKSAFKVDHIHSEYGMTELLSQAYSNGEGEFTCPPSMKILLREVNDPFSYLPSFAIGDPTDKSEIKQKTGALNVIDLGNIDSCCFIETKDLGKFSNDYQTFSILGRLDNTDLRGCNLMVN